MKTIKARFEAKRDDGPYTVYVFSDLDNGGYVMATLLPNWNNMDDLQGTGYLKYDSVEAGQEYTTPMGNISQYRYTNNYILNFLKIK